MKTLILLAMFAVSTNAMALECGETQRSSSTENTSVDVETKAEKFREGQTLARISADGKVIETVSAEEYMLVKRKHKRPVIKETTKESSLACKASDRKNIVSLKAVDGYSDVKKTQTATSASIEVERQVGVGIQYQRAVTERLYLGVGADSNRGAEALVGVSF